MINPITLDNFAALFNCRPVDRTSESMMAKTLSHSFQLIGTKTLSSVVGPPDDLLLLQISSYVVWQTRDLHLSRNRLYLLSPRLCFFIFFKRDLSVHRDDLFL